MYSSFVSLDEIYWSPLFVHYINNHLKQPRKEEKKLNPYGAHSKMGIKFKKQYMKPNEEMRKGLMICLFY